MNDSSSDSEFSVLIVDHDPNELKALVIGLRLEGFSVAGAPSSSAALELLSEKHFDIALIDLMIPETNGLQLSRAIRAAFPAVTTILMSAYHLSMAQLVRANTGAVGFVPKPFRFDDLVQFIRAKIAQRSGEGAAPTLTPHHTGGGLHAPFELPQAI